MMQESLVNSPFLAGIAITLIHFLWQGVLVALVLKVLLSLISHQKSQTRYGLASLAMVANLALPLITFFIVYDIEYRQATNFAQTLPLLDQSLFLEQRQANTWYFEWFEYLPSISIIWLSIVTLLATKVLIELYNVNKLPQQGTVKADIALQARFDNLVAKVGVTRKVTLLLSTKANIPMAIGWLKPIVLIPFSMVSGLTPQQLDMLLLHELAHIRRHDYFVNFLQTLVETLLFFHPAVRWVSKQMRNEREYCSDDIAVEHSGNALAYAHTLADTASLCQKHRHHAIPNMAMAASGGDLKQRVVRLLDNQPNCTQATESGKWLASFTILFAIIFGFSKYSLTLPVIDLQSGSISLAHSPVELKSSAAAFAPIALEQVSSNSSLARQLIAINSTETPQEPNAAKASSNIKNDIKVKNTPEKSTTKQAKLAQNSTTKYQRNTSLNELPIVLGSSEAVTKASVSKPLTVSKETQKSKSISELAFERTDSKSNQATLDNPYSEQVASLLNEPKPSENALNSASLNKTIALEPTTLSNKTYGEFEHNVSDNLKRNYRNNLAENTVINPKHKQAKLIASTEPRYPSSAKRKGIEIEIMVEFNIDKNGLVKDIQFESKSKVSYFRNAIRNAMEKWRFLPAEKNGVAVESKMSKIFSFSLLK